jgi:uncharacterized protein (DUF2236 family)
MLIGGLASLLLQTLHPLAMAGVAQHSRYKDDPLGRLERTARFVGMTTFGSRDDALRAVASVRKQHARVHGSYQGRSYTASDPELLSWVHAAEVSCFLGAAQRYGPRRFDPAEQDDYLTEVAQIAVDLGAAEVPRSRAELEDYFRAVRLELRLTDEARAARNFILRGIGRWPHEVASYQLLVVAAQGLLPHWARSELRLLDVPIADRVVVRPAAIRFCSTIRRLASSPPQIDSESPPSTAMT